MPAGPKGERRPADAIDTGAFVELLVAGASVNLQD